MPTGIEFRESNPDIGLLTRTPKPGPELDMVEREAPGLVGMFMRSAQEAAVFWEPKVDVGFPDLVLAIFYPAVYNSWTNERSTITTTHMKIVHQLFSSRGMSSASLEKRLGFTSRELLRSFERLLDAGLVRRSNSQWRLMPFSDVFGIHRLIAIEAKLSNWTEAFMQAESNTWFASESYVLSPVTQPKVTTQDKSSAHHVGILTSGKGTLQKVVPSSRNRLPASYGSWQFNEWIGRELNRKVSR